MEILNRNVDVPMNKKVGQSLFGKEEIEIEARSQETHITRGKVFGIHETPLLGINSPVVTQFIC